MDASAKVVIHGEEWILADIQPMIENCRKRIWRQQRWVPRDALVQRGGDATLPYFGQPYNPAEFELMRGAWKRNLCEICSWELCESSDATHATGYTEGRRWLCNECYEKFIRR